MSGFGGLEVNSTCLTALGQVSSLVEGDYGVELFFRVTLRLLVQVNELLMLHHETFWKISCSQLVGTVCVGA